MNAKQKRMLMFFMPLVVFALLIVMFFMKLGKPTDVIVSTSIGKPLPAFSLPLLSSPDRVMTNADLPKQPFLLNAWGSWCPTCKIEHPMLLELAKQGVPMVGVNYKDELPNALAYLDTYKDPFVYSVQDLDGMYGIDLGLTGAPETFVVDAKGVVYQHITGEITQENWQRQIEPCMQELARAGSDEASRAKVCKL